MMEMDVAGSKAIKIGCLRMKKGYCKNNKHSKLTIIIIIIISRDNATLKIVFSMKTMGISMLIHPDRQRN
jgi:hypothetical protein